MLANQNMLDSIVGLQGGSLVYLPVHKNASTFFGNNLVENFRWTEIKFKDIDWSRHHVFSYIQDPIQRRHKGIAEYLEITNTMNLLDTIPFQNFIRHVPALDDHSNSLFEKFGPYCWMIDWIPLDYGHDRTIELTEKLIQFSGIKILKNMWNLRHQHVSSDYKKKLTNKLKDLWEEKPPKSTALLYFSNDMILYQQVKEKFNPFGDYWHQMNWLRDKYGNT